MQLTAMANCSAGCGPLSGGSLLAKRFLSSLNRAGPLLLALDEFDRDDECRNKAIGVMFDLVREVRRQPSNDMRPKRCFGSTRRWAQATDFTEDLPH
jgi:hypothetical protein